MTTETMLQRSQDVCVPCAETHLELCYKVGLGSHMETIKDIILRAKHWQVFIILVILPLIAEFATTLLIPGDVNPSNGETLLSMTTMFFYLACVLAWFWAVGSFSSSIVAPDLQMKDGFFYFALIYPLLYIPLFISIVFKPGPTTLLISPLHLFGMYCMFYALYFVSKSLAMAETGRSVTFYEYAGPFFLIWFYPLGVWLIQPKINQLYAPRRS